MQDLYVSILYLSARVKFVAVLCPTFCSCAKSLPIPGEQVVAVVEVAVAEAAVAEWLVEAPVVEEERVCIEIMRTFYESYEVNLYRKKSS